MPLNLKSIEVDSRRWIDSAGNTYFSADIFVNEEHRHKIDFEYGYGEQYLAASTKWLIANNYLPKACKWLAAYSRKNNVQLTIRVKEVKRKKDM
tara:strand:+ start:154 stop:435 length:282 start_codon:yes stop_codon:yes gene_type:complete